MKPTWVSSCGRATLYCADCLAVLPTLEAGSVDAVVTDPPWGIGYGSGTTSIERGKSHYESKHFDDSEVYVQTLVPIVMSAIRRCGRGIVTPGVPCMWAWDKPDAVGGFFQPAAIGMGPWGFANYNPILFYGMDPRRGRGQDGVMRQLTDGPSNKEHPCAKPEVAMLWLVRKATVDGETVLDPFMGSGTTGVAAIKTGRRFIGIEIEEKYFKIAKRRIQQAIEDYALFQPPPEKPKQEEMFP